MNSNAETNGAAKKRGLLRMLIPTLLSAPILLCLGAYYILSSRGDTQTAQQLLLYAGPLLLIYAWYIRIRILRDRGRQEDLKMQQAVTEMENSGPLVESITSDASIGSLVDTLTLDVYPGGFIIYAKRMPKKAICAEDISEISYQESDRNSGLVIKFKTFNKKVSGPVVLRGVSLDSRIGAALTNLAGPFKVKWTRPV